MPFFKLRRSDSAAAPAASTPAQAQSVEDLRKRARHRLIGTSLLVALGIVGFPLLFDTQPRPVAVDIPIEIPGKNSARVPTSAVPATTNAVAPAVAASAPAVAAASAPPLRAAVTAPSSKVAAAASLGAQEELFASRPVSPAKPDAVPDEIRKEAKPDGRNTVEAKPRTEPKPVSRPIAKVDAPLVAPKPPQGDDDGARVAALLNGGAAAQVPRSRSDTRPDAAKPVAVAEVKSRTVVQVGAFADTAKADEIRRKLEKAGIKTYTQVAETKNGKRIRVRVGPYASRAEAEKAGEKIRSLDLPAAILSF